MEESKDSDMDIYKDKYYEDHTVEFVDEDEKDEFGDFGQGLTTLRKTSLACIDSISSKIFFV